MTCGTSLFARTVAGCHSRGTRQASPTPRHCCARKRTCPPRSSGPLPVAGPWCSRTPPRGAALRAKAQALALLLVLGIASPQAARGGEYLLIRSAKNATPQLTPAQLRDLLLGRAKRWPSGAVFQLVLAEEPSGALEWLGSQWLSSTAAFLLGKIRLEAFRGELRKPLVAVDDAEAAAKVKTHDGGLAVVSIDFKLPAGVLPLAVLE